MTTVKLLCVYVNTDKQKFRFLATNDMKNAQGTMESLNLMLEKGWLASNIKSVTMSVEDITLS